MNTIATEVVGEAGQAGRRRALHLRLVVLDLRSGRRGPGGGSDPRRDLRGAPARRLLELEVRGRAAPAADGGQELLSGRAAQGDGVRLVAAHAFRPGRQHVPQGRADARPHHHPLRRRDVASAGRRARRGARLHGLHRGRRRQGARPDLQRDLPQHAHLGAGAAREGRAGRERPERSRSRPTTATPACATTASRRARSPRCSTSVRW